MRRRPPPVAAISTKILNPAGDRRGAISSNRSRRIMKKPDMGSLRLVPTSRWVSRVASLEMVSRDPARPLRAAARHIAGGGHQIGLIARQPGQHGGQHLFVMLQVGVDHRHIGRRRRQHALDAGPRQAPPPHPAQAAHPGSARAISLTTPAVPSGELSSTKMASQAIPDKARSSRRTSSATFPRSLNVGTTTESWGVTLASPGD